MKEYKIFKKEKYIYEPLRFLALNLFFTIFALLTIPTFVIIVCNFNKSTNILMVFPLAATFLLSIIEIFIVFRSIWNSLRFGFRAYKGVKEIFDDLFAGLNIAKIVKAANYAYTKNLNLINNFASSYCDDSDRKTELSRKDFYFEALCSNESISEKTLLDLVKIIENSKLYSFYRFLFYKALLRNPATSEDLSVHIIEKVATEKPTPNSQNSIIKICEMEKFKNYSAVTIFRLLEIAPWLYPTFENHCNYNMNRYTEEFCEV